MRVDLPVLEDIGLVLFCSKIECGAAITAACLPTIKVLFSKSTLGKVVRHLRSKLPFGSHDMENQPPAGSSVEQMTRTEASRFIESGAVGANRPLSLAGPHGGGAMV